MNSTILRLYAAQHGTPLRSSEAQLLLNYLRGCDYDLHLESGVLYRDDYSYSQDEAITEPYTLPEVVAFALKSNHELIDWEQAEDEPDMVYIAELYVDQEKLYGIQSIIQRDMIPV